MVKIIFLCLLFALLANAQDAVVKVFHNKCLSCHIKQQIPSELIYRRYLMKYSTKDAIHEAMMKYLKKPNKEKSIMPSQFFLKFPMKPNLKYEDAMLHQNIDAYLDYFDIRKKLILEP